jgi:hypothetical protein
MAMNRYMIRCCYCKQTFAMEGVAPWQSTHAACLDLVLAHGCPKTLTRLDVRTYGSTDAKRRGQAAYDILTADYRIAQVRGSYRADVRCNGRCTHAKGGDCTCECGGANHGTGLVLTTHHIHAA